MPASSEHVGSLHQASHQISTANSSLWRSLQWCETFHLIIRLAPLPTRLLVPFVVTSSVPLHLFVLTLLLLFLLH